MKTLSDNLYKTFSHRERLHLTIAALGRDDIAEAKKLRSSCPKKTYIMNDAAYEDQLQAFEKLRISFIGDLSPPVVPEVG